MAYIQERKANNGKKRYRVQVRLKGYPTQSATFKRLTDARRWAQQTESAIREGRHFKKSEAKRHTLAEMLERYTRDVLPLKPRSQLDQTGQLRWWSEQIGQYALADVTPAMIAEHRDKLLHGSTKQGKQRTPATVNRYLAVLSHAFTIAFKEWGWLEENPMRKVQKLKEPRGRVRYLLEDERSRLLKECRENRNPYLYTVVVLALSTGMRRMEILGLTWGDVDLQRGLIILLETKNNERRSVPLVGHALEVLKEFSKLRRIDTNLLFPSKGNPQKPMDIRTPWETALKKVNITDFRFHDLRHSCASYLAMNGATLAEIAEVLGHKTLQMVKRYAHLSEAHTSRVVERMNASIFDAGREEDAARDSLKLGMRTRKGDS